MQYDMKNEKKLPIWWVNAQNIVFVKMFLLKEMLNSFQKCSSILELPGSYELLTEVY